jgi:hypothetical protein
MANNQQYEGLADKVVGQPFSEESYNSPRGQFLIGARRIL